MPELKLKFFISLSIIVFSSCVKEVSEGEREGEVIYRDLHLRPFLQN